MERRISTTHVWERVDQLRVGDRIHRWGDDLEIIELESLTHEIAVYVLDDGAIKRWVYRPEEEVILRMPVRPGASR